MQYCKSMDIHFSLSIIDEIKAVIEPCFVAPAYQESGLNGRFKQVVALCQEIIERTLLADLEITGTPSTHKPLGSAAELRKALLELVPTHSPFWDKYETRLQFIDSIKNSTPIQKLDAYNFGQWARKRYPSFYIVQDVIYYSEGGDRIKYELILQSLQRYLNGQLLRLGGHHVTAKFEFSKALKLNSNAGNSQYREHLKLLIQSEQLA